MAVLLAPRGRKVDAGIGRADDHCAKPLVHFDLRAIRRAAGRKRRGVDLVRRLDDEVNVDDGPLEDQVADGAADEVQRDAGTVRLADE